jgi:O-antigen/teichoic acid export membrane protein
MTAGIIFFIVKKPSLALIIAVFGIVFLLWMLREFGRRYLFANMQVAKVVVMSGVGGLTQLILIGALAWTSRLTDATALAAMGIASGISGFGWLWLSRASFHFKRRRWSHFALKNWVFGRWILASHVMAVVAGNAMPWLIVVWLGPAGTGVFAACDSILRFANPIIVSLNNILTPQLAIGFKNGGKAALHRIVWQTTGLLALFLLAFCTVLVVAGKWILNWAFGSEFVGYEAALVLLAVTQLIESVALASSRALMVLDRAKVNLFAEGVGFTAALIAAVVLIPLYGILGAACAQLVGGVTLMVVTVGAYLASVRDEDGIDLFSFGRTTPAPAPNGGGSD